MLFSSASVLTMVVVFWIQVKVEEKILDSDDDFGEVPDENKPLLWKKGFS